MNFPEIKVHLLAKSVPDRDAVRAWVREMKGGENHELPVGASDAELLIGYAAKRCYKSFEASGMNPNVTKVRKDLTKFFDNILRSGHGSTLEHATWTFGFENVTRVFTAELNRHRAGVAISEQSLRYVRFDDIPFWIPPSLVVDSDDGDELAERKRRTRTEMEVLLGRIESTYTKLVEVWGLDDPDANFGMKKHITSMLRRIIPLGVCTGGTWTFNCRALRHIIAMRTDAAAEEEIAYVFSRVARIMVESEPRLFGDFELQNNGTTWTPVWKKV